MRTPTVRRRLLAAIAVAAGFAIPAAAAAHPLGNFTINHYAALRVGPDRIDLDVVVDLAEIPAFQERIRIDLDGDGLVSEAETDAARPTECEALQPSFNLSIDAEPVAATLVAAGLSFPAGAAGVPTMRIVCELRAEIQGGLAEGSIVEFADVSFLERIGWREIVVVGDAMTIEALAGGDIPTVAGVSDRLTTYPADLLTQPLAVESVAFGVRPGGPAAAPFTAPDAAPFPGSPTADPSESGASPGSSPAPSATAGPAIVPGGVGGEIPGIFQVADLTPLIALGSIVLAMALGAGHALTPGHGKTLMAAYLVGTRGTIRHAAGLGLAVTVSHTLGILVLAVLVTGAESILPADTVVRWVPVIAALAFVAIGAVMVFSEVSRRRRGARLRAALTADHDHDHDHDHDDGHDDGPELGAGHDHGHEDGHSHEHEHEHEHEPEGPASASVAAEHSHGGIRHSHVPADDRTLTWKSLFALGLAGGIIPSTNALIILLGTIVAGRAAFGIVLVVAFGLGMAIVLGGVGAAMVVARERMERLPTSSTLGRVAAQAPLVASLAVLGIGLWLTAQAIGGGTVF
jgi:ABC-type nickel/cobalt efflux system permease component RcnA